MDPGEYDALLRTLTGIAAHQETIHADLRELLRQQVNPSAELRVRNRQQVEINATMEATLAHMDTTLARMRTLLARILPPDDAGTEA